jgi:hypothetical protein
MLLQCMSCVCRSHVARRRVQGTVEPFPVLAESARSQPSCPRLYVHVPSGTELTDCEGTGAMGSVRVESGHVVLIEPAVLRHRPEVESSRGALNVVQPGF